MCRARLPRVVSASFFLLFTDCSCFSAMLMPCSSSLCRNVSKLKSAWGGKTHLSAWHTESPDGLHAVQTGLVWTAPASAVFIQCWSFRQKMGGFGTVGVGRHFAFNGLYACREISVPDGQHIAATVYLSRNYIQR